MQHTFELSTLLLTFSYASTKSLYFKHMNADLRPRLVRRRPPPAGGGRPVGGVVDDLSSCAQICGGSPCARMWLLLVVRLLRAVDGWGLGPPRVAAAPRTSRWHRGLWRGGAVVFLLLCVASAAWVRSGRFGDNHGRR